MELLKKLNRTNQKPQVFFSTSLRFFIYMPEIWKPIAWFDWCYSVSSLWNIKSHNFKHKGIDWILKQHADKLWRKCIKLWRSKQFYVSRIVAIAFINNPNKHPCVLHRIEKIPQDNSIDNLWWWTHADNMRDMFSKSRDNNALKNRTWKILWKGFHRKKILQYSLNWEFIKEWNTILDASKELWLYGSNIVNVCKWRYKKTWWFIFKYKNYEQT